MSSDDNKIEINGIVVAANGNGIFSVKLDGQEEPTVCYLSGKIRRHNIRINEGSIVKVELTVYDLSKGMIVYRIK